MMEHSRHKSSSQLSMYGLLALMTVLMFIAMYALMYAMVDRWENVFPNINQAYMAGLMTAPMVLIELAVMNSMYKNRSLNLFVVLLTVIFGLLCWFGIRQQWAVGNEQFLKSMIPHHAGAVLMCGEAPITRDDIRSLCRQIIESQQAEIATMKRMIEAPQ